MTAHSLKDGAAGQYKGGFGFAPVMAYLDQSGEALAGLLRPGNRAPHNAADQIAVSEQALAQIPVEQIAKIPILLRMDSAGATHKLIDWCRERDVRFSVGYDLTEPVRAGIVKVPEDAWVPALDQDGSQRPNGQVSELTELVNLSGWPQGTRLICRRERPHPGAQLSFTDHDGYRFQAFLTDPSRKVFVREFTQSPVGSLPPNGQHVVFELINIFRYDDEGPIEDEYVQIENRIVLQQIVAEDR